MDPKFSFVVPIYKVDRFLKECIDSLIAQKNNAFEIILVNDGSPDNCPDICNQYASKWSNIKVIHKKNGGLVSARKDGAKISRGEYVCCVDGDDMVSDDYLEILTQIIDMYNPDVVCFDYIRHTPNGNTFVNSYGNLNEGLYGKERIEREIFPWLIMDSCGNYFLPTVWSKVFKRELYLKHQMMVNEKITMGEDGACTIPIMIQAESIYVSRSQLYYYRNNDDSMTNGRKIYSWENQELIDELLYKATEDSRYDFSEQLSRRITRGFFNTAKSQFNSDGNYSTIRKDILDHISFPIFESAINNCHFSKGLKVKIMETCLKKRLVLPIYIMNKLSF
ncbi:MAG: glycosyltransferase [Clostridia bacterium]|nr:glycosyltransferase [Clostridia bacterium]